MASDPTSLRKSSKKTATVPPRRAKGPHLGIALKAARQEKNVRLRELSTELNVSLPYLSDVENGRRPLSDDRIKQAAHFLGVDALPLLEIATRDRGKIVLDISTLPDDRRLRAVMLLSMNWPNVPAATVDYLLRNLKESV